MNYCSLNVIHLKGRLFRICNVSPGRKNGEELMMDELLMDEQMMNELMMDELLMDELLMDELLMDEQMN